VRLVKQAPLQFARHGKTTPRALKVAVPRQSYADQSVNSRSEALSWCLTT